MKYCTECLQPDTRPNDYFTDEGVCVACHNFKNNIGINYLTNKFDTLGINYIPSYTNFITTIWKDSKEAKFISNNLLEKGIIVRRLSSFGWGNSIRISIGTEKENSQFIDVLKSFF